MEKFHERFLTLSAKNVVLKTFEVYVAGVVNAYIKKILHPLWRFMEPFHGINLMATSQPSQILVIDNNPRFLYMIQEFFEPFEQYGLIGYAQRAIEGLRMAKELKPDIILLDLYLEEVTGIDLIPGLLVIQPEVTIIMLTIYDVDIYRRHAEATGAKGYVLKEDIFTDLIPTIKENISVK